MRILLCGDTPGITQLLANVSTKDIVGIIAASIRPQYVTELTSIAEKAKVPIFIQPKWRSIDYVEFKRQIIEISPDIILINSYSMIIREDILSIPRFGGLNIHTALLPRNRGCNPTQWAILNKEFETGVTLHEIDSGLDTGPIVDQIKIPIYFQDTWVDIRGREAQATNDLLKSNLPQILSGSWQAVPQKNKNASTSRRRTPKDGEFFWSEKIVDIHNKIRALVPPLPPTYYLRKDGKKVEYDKYLTPWEITSLKYDPEVGGGSMKTGRINLRPLTKSYSRLLFKWITDRDLVRFNSSYFPVSESDHEVWIEKMMRKHSDLVIFVVEEKKEKKAIGTCQLFNINWVHRNAELQIRIGEKENEGKSYGSEAVRLICEFGFEDLSLHRIFLQVLADNDKEIKLYQECGFILEGTQQEAAFVDGQWKDVVFMGKLAGNE